MVNQTALNASGGAFNNGLPPTISIGCGFWGGNSIGENLTYKHLLNYTRVSRIIPDAPNPTPEEIWANNSASNALKRVLPQAMQIVCGRRYIVRTY